MRSDHIVDTRKFTSIQLLSCVHAILSHHGFYAERRNFRDDTQEPSQGKNILVNQLLTVALCNRLHAAKSLVFTRLFRLLLGNPSSLAFNFYPGISAGVFGSSQPRCQLTVPPKQNHYLKEQLIPAK